MPPSFGISWWLEHIGQHLAVFFTVALETKTSLDWSLVNNFHTYSFLNHLQSLGGDFNYFLLPRSLGKRLALWWTFLKLKRGNHQLVMERLENRNLHFQWCRFQFGNIGQGSLNYPYSGEYKKIHMLLVNLSDLPITFCLFKVIFLLCTHGKSPLKDHHLGEYFVLFSKHLKQIEVMMHCEGSCHTIWWFRNPAPGM